MVTLRSVKRREGEEEVRLVLLLSSFASHGEDYNTTNCFPVVHKVHEVMQHSPAAHKEKVLALEWVDTKKL